MGINFAYWKVFSFWSLDFGEEAEESQYWGFTEVYWKVFLRVIYIAGSNDFGSPLLTIDNNTHIPTLEFAPIEVDLSVFSGESVQIKLKGVRGDVADFWLDTDDYIIEGQEPTSVS